MKKWCQILTTSIDDEEPVIEKTRRYTFSEAEIHAALVAYVADKPNGEPYVDMYARNTSNDIVDVKPIEAVVTIKEIA